MSGPRTPPRSIVEPDGTVHEGWFRQPFVHANMDEAPVFPWLSGRLRRWSVGLARRTRLKQWHYGNVVTPEHFLAACVLDAGYLGVAFVYVVNRRTREVFEYGARTPLGRGLQIAPNSLDGVTRADVAGFGTVCFTNDSTGGRRALWVDVAGHETAPALSASFCMVDDGSHPMVAVDRLAARRWLYTHKQYGLSAEGHLSLGGEVTQTATGTALAGLDWNRGYRCYETFWNWAAATGFDTRGRAVGFSFTTRKPRLGHDGEPSGGKAEDGFATDCAIWAGGQVWRVRGVRFHYEADDVLKTWRVVDADGLVDLTFEPWGERLEDTNFGLIVSVFHQPYGVFHGTLRHPDGESYSIQEVFGVTEEHFARW
jgi:hypothetical protein